MITIISNAYKRIDEKKTFNTTQPHESITSFESEMIMNEAQLIIVAGDVLEMLFSMKIFRDNKLFLTSRFIDYGGDFCAWVLNY